MSARKIRTKTPGDMAQRLASRLSSDDYLSPDNLFQGPPLDPELDALLDEIAEEIRQEDAASGQSAK